MEKFSNTDYYSIKLINNSSLQRFYKKAAAFVLRAVAKHSPQLAQVKACQLHIY